MAGARVSTASLPRIKPNLNAAALTLIGVGGFALLTAASAELRIPAPGTPVPITLQTLVVLLAGFALGPVRGAASQGLYLAVGTAGLPVFAAASRTLSPVTGGYLIGFVFAALAVGYLHRRLPSTLGAMALTTAIGTAIIFAFGVGWLTWLLGGNVALAAQQGLFPFLPGAVLKGAAVVGIVRAASTVRRRLAETPNSN